MQSISKSNHKKSKVLASTIFTFSLLTACGGGGGSGNPAQPSIPVTAATPSNKYTTIGNYLVTDCVKDNTTGLVWEGKNTSGLRAGTNTYTNYDNFAVEQVPVWCNAGSISSFLKPTLNQINSEDNSIGYVNSVNASKLCGYSDWRMPTKEELSGLIKTGSDPIIDLAWFPNVNSNWYWTSTIYSGNSRYAELVYSTYSKSDAIFAITNGLAYSALSDGDLLRPITWVGDSTVNNQTIQCISNNGRNRDHKYPIRLVR